MISENQIEENDDYDDLDEKKVLAKHQEFYRTRIPHYFTRLMNEYAIESKKWSELSIKVKDRFGKCFSERRLRYMFNEHKYWEDFINLKMYADLNGMSLSEFIIYIESSNEGEINTPKRWQKEIVDVLNIIDNEKDIKIRQKITTNLVASILGYRNELVYLAEIMDIFNKFLYKRRGNTKNKDAKLMVALEALKSLLA